MWVLLLVVIIFLFLRIHHYTWARRDQNHDRYLSVREKCSQGELKYVRCPDLDMWGLKWSIVITLLVVNSFLVLALYFRQ